MSVFFLVIFDQFILHCKMVGFDGFFVGLEKLSILAS